MQIYNPCTKVQYPVIYQNQNYCILVTFLWHLDYLYNYKYCIKNSYRNNTYYLGAKFEIIRALRREAASLKC